MKNTLTTMLTALALCLMLFTSALATTSTTVDVQGLTPEQAAKVKAEVAKAEAENAQKAATAAAAPTVDRVTKAKELLEIAQSSGAAMAAFGSSMGQAGDKFLESTTGKIIAGLAIYNFGGGKALGIIAQAIMHFSVGLLFLLIALPIWWKLLRKHALGEKTEIKIFEDQVVINGAIQTVRRQAPVTSTNVKGNTVASYWVVLAIIIFLFLGITFWW